MAALATEAKQWACPRCGRQGTLNRHGRLETKSGTLRGLRFWCSPRRKSNPGCGLTFSIMLAAFVPGLCVPSAALAAFLLAWSLLGGDVLAAWRQARTGFFLSASLANDSMAPAWFISPTPRSSIRFAVESIFVTVLLTFNDRSRAVGTVSFVTQLVIERLSDITITIARIRIGWFIKG